MTSGAICIENLGKQYTLGARRGGAATLRDVIAGSVSGIGARMMGRAVQSARATREQMWAVRNVSFDVKPGEVVGVIGRNGAGKSTLLKLLSRITEPTEGQATMWGRVGSLLEVGTGFHPELSGRENVYLSGIILGMGRKEVARSFDEIVAFAEVEKHIDTPVKHYSSGMYVRLAFAVAAHLEPEILIVDEVLAVGDAAFQQKCLAKMSGVARDGRTIFFVSHNMAAVQALCQRGVVLQGGRVVADGPTYEAVAAYLRTMETAAMRPASERTDRGGAGTVRLAHVGIYSDEQVEARTLATGRPATFAFDVSSTPPSLGCRFTIYDQLGQAVATFSTSPTSATDERVPGLGSRFECRIDELGLVPGRYRINVGLFSEGVLQDHLEGAALFEVEQGVLRGRPIASGTGYGSACLPHRWQLPS